MRVLAGAKNHVRGLILGFLVVMCAWPMFASSQSSGGTLYATSITGTSAGGAGLSGTLNMTYDAASKQWYYQAPVSVGWGTLGNALRSAMRGAGRFLPYVGLAMTAADLAGWDMADGWFNKGDGVPSRDISSGTSFWCATPQIVMLPATYCTENKEQMRSFMNGQKIGPADPAYGQTITRVVDGWDDSLVLQSLTGGTVTGSVTVARQVTLPTEYRTPEYRPATDVTELELVQAMANLGPGAHHTMLHDSNGRPHMFPEVYSAMQGTANGIANSTGTNVTVGGSPVDPTSPDNPAPVPGADPLPSELPAFCEWAKVVCDFITWYKDEGEPLKDVELPVEEGVDPTVSWSSGQSAGSCPSPESVEVMGTTVQFTYQPICDFATFVRPILIAGVLAISAFIIAGLRSTND